MKQRLLITGASGFIGRNLFEYFSKKEDGEVFGTYKSRLSVPSSRMYCVDLTQEDAARGLFEEIKPDVLIHAAAATVGFHEFKKNEGTFIHANVLMNTNIIALATEYAVRHVVLLGCSLAYPSRDSTVREEDAVVLSLDHPYKGGATVKSVMEDLAFQYARMNGGNTIYTIIRHSNIYGPYDKFDGRGHMVASKIPEVVNAKDGETIIVRGHGTERRDLLHIDDLVQFIDSALRNSNPRTDVWNVGYGFSFSVNEIVKKIVDVSGKQLTILNDNFIISAPTQSVLDCQKAKSAFDWEPKIKLEDGLRMTMEWYKANKNPV